MSVLKLPQRNVAHRWAEHFALLLAVLGTGMVFLDETAVTLALPNLQRNLGANIGAVQWIWNSYLLTLVALLLIGGALGDRYGRVRVYAVGTIIFLAGSLGAALAPSVAVLIGTRLVQGAGGALMLANGLAIINVTIAPGQRGRVLGTWAIFVSLIKAVGPIPAGWLIDLFSWRVAFLLNVPLALLAAYVAINWVPDSRNGAATNGRLDWPGVLLLFISLAGLVYALIEGPSLGWRHPQIVAAAVVGVVAIALFLQVETHSANPILPPAVGRNLAFVGINLITVAHIVTVAGLHFFLALNLQQVQGFSSFATGLALMPISLLIALFSRPIGNLCDRFGPQALIVAGVMLMGLSFWLFSRLGIETTYWTSFFPVTLLFGIGLGLNIVPITSTALGTLPNQYSGLASGLNNAASRFASMLAVAVLGSVMVIRFKTALVAETAVLPVDAIVRGNLLARVRDLGAITLPNGLSQPVATALNQAVARAFVTAFQQTMLLCAAIILVGLAAFLLLLRLDARSADAQHGETNQPVRGRSHRAQRVSTPLQSVVFQRVEVNGDAKHRTNIEPL